MEIQQEMVRQQEFEELVGGWERAEQLRTIYKESKPLPSWNQKLGEHDIPKIEVFRIKAENKGFTKKEISAFLNL
jgi:hypothetical protein